MTFLSGQMSDKETENALKVIKSYEKDDEWYEFKVKTLKKARKDDSLRQSYDTFGKVKA